MNARCPSDLALEGFLLERSSSKLVPHVDTCPRCQGRVAEMERQGQEFMQYVYPRTVERIEEAAAGGRSRPSWMRWLYALPVPLAAAAVAVLILVQHGEKQQATMGLPEDAVQIKGGGGLGLTVFLGEAEGARPVADGENVPAAASLRFKVQPTRVCRLWVVSVDGSGGVSRLYPVAGEGGAEVRKGGPLPGGAVLDGRGGPERILAVCSPSPTAYSSIEDAMRRTYAGGEGAVRSVRVVPGLPDGTAQDSVLIQKRP
jgi:hypothetical protein